MCLPRGLKICGNDDINTIVDRKNNLFTVCVCPLTGDAVICQHKAVYLFEGGVKIYLFVCVRGGMLSENKPFCLFA